MNFQDSSVGRYRTGTLNGDAPRVNPLFATSDALNDQAVQVSLFRWRAVAPAPTRTQERKVRTPQGSTPCESGGALNESSLRRKVSQKIDRFIISPSDERSLRAVMREVRVKRRGKSPPPCAKAKGHDKPCAVQDKTGGTGRLPGLAMRVQPPGNSRSLKAAQASKLPEQDK